MNKQGFNFWSYSYKRHIDREKEITEKENKWIDSWKRFDTVDAWRHKRMYTHLLPLIANYPDSSWLTIGDGRFGTDSNYLIRNGIKNVLTTSISDVLIKQAKEEGFIQNYKVENAENLSFEENSFDFVLCKEAYHHFPRPMLALYEMIRVSKMGVILIEPNDPNIEVKTPDKTIIPIQSKKRWQATKDYIKDLLKITRYQYNKYVEPAYEESGNYIFSISEREIEKVALGLNLPFIAFNKMNDSYLQGVEFEKADDDSPLFKKIKKEIHKQDISSERGSTAYGILITIILKKMPENNFIEDLQKNNFKFQILKRNPYIKE